MPTRKPYQSNKLTSYFTAAVDSSICVTPPSGHTEGVDWGGFHDDRYKANSRLSMNRLKQDRLLEFPVLIPSWINSTSKARPTSPFLALSQPCFFRSTRSITWELRHVPRLYWTGCNSTLLSSTRQSRQDSSLNLLTAASCCC